MGLSWFVVKHNLKWMLALALIFAFASGVLSNASSLSQWYSKTLTEEFLNVTNVDFVVSQNGRVDRVKDVYETIPKLEEVNNVVSEIILHIGFYRSYYFVKPIGGLVGGAGYTTMMHSRNGTKFLLTFPLPFCSYLGLENLINVSDLGASYPKQGEAIIPRDLARLLDIGTSDNLTMETPDGLLIFRVSGVTDLSLSTIQQKFRKPYLPLQFFPSPYPSFEQLKFAQTTSGELVPYWATAEETDHEGLIVSSDFGWFAILSPEDSIDLFSTGWMSENPSYSISHYVYTERKMWTEPLNIDKTISNLQRIKDRLELTASDAPASVNSDVLTLFETAAKEINLFAIIAGGFMLAALPLYWFVAYPITDLFVDKKRGEIALLRIKGLSLRGTYLAYITLIVVSAVTGGILGALLQANILQILASLHVIGPQYMGTLREFQLALPDPYGLFSYVIISVVLAIFTAGKLIKSIGSLQPAEAVRLTERSEKAPRRVEKLTILLLCLGLVKLITQFAGLNSLIYFRYLPSNPFLAMGLVLFATFDNYALTAFAPVFVAYGFARLISAKSDKIGLLLWPFSFLAGLRRRKISCHLLLSDIWRTAATFTLITLVLSYGVGSYISNCSVAEHTWKLAGEFTGADLRVECLPNATLTVEETIKAIPELSNYTRIDVLISNFWTFVEPIGKGASSYYASYSSFFSLIAIDPEAYVNVAYLENAPDLKKALANLKPEHIIGLKAAQSAEYVDGQLVKTCTFPATNTSMSWDQFSFGHLLNESVPFDIDKWFNASLPGTIESAETRKTAIPLEGDLEPLKQAYSFPLEDLSYAADVLLPHTSEGALFSFGGFAIRQEDQSKIKHEHVKSIFIIKLKPSADPDDVAAELIGILRNGSVITTRSEAVDVMRKGFPGLAAGLDFTTINYVLIVTISFGGVVVVTMTTTMGRKTIFSLLRIRGGKRKDSVALFLPETALISLLACLLGTAIGLALGAGFVNSMVDLIPHLFTGNTIQIFLSPLTWCFTVAVLAIFSTVQIASIAAKSAIDL